MEPMMLAERARTPMSRKRARHRHPRPRLSMTGPVRPTIMGPAPQMVPRSREAPHSGRHSWMRGASSHVVAMAAAGAIRAAASHRREPTRCSAMPPRTTSASTMSSTVSIDVRGNTKGAVTRLHQWAGSAEADPRGKASDQVRQTATPTSRAAATARVAGTERSHLMPNRTAVADHCPTVAAHLRALLPRRATPEGACSQGWRCSSLAPGSRCSPLVLGVRCSSFARRSWAPSLVGMCSF